MFSFLHHLGIMRRIWLTLLIAFSLAVGGVASASAAQNCPFRSAPAATHDCCPDNAMKKATDTDHHSKKTSDCLLGQACRASVAVAANLPVLKSTLVEGASPAPVASVAQPAPTVSFAFWRPPRTV